MNTTKQSPHLSLKNKTLLGILALAFFTSCVKLNRIIDKPVFIVGGNNGRSEINCSQEFEAVPTAVTNPVGDIAWFASFGFNRMTYAKGDWSNWSAGSPNVSSPGFSVPVNGTDELNLNSLSGDSWSSYSEAKNLAFFYFIGRRSDSNGNPSSCFAVAATSPQKLETGDWTYPAVCLSDLRSDQGAILHIDATNTFYAVSKLDGDILLQAFDDCNGAPGPTYGCPRTAMTRIPGANALQFSLAENPCTGNLILVYRKNKEIRLRFYDENLNNLNEYVVRENQPFENGQTNVGCSKGTIRRCGMGGNDCCNSLDCNTDAPGTCLRVNGRPSIDTYQKEFNGNQICGAVVAYDALIGGEDGNPWSKSRLDIIDVTSEQSPSIISQWNSTSSKFTWNQYMSYAVVSDNGQNSKSPKIAWFWLTDIRGECKVIAEGATSINLGTSMQATGIISGPFPAPSLSNTSGIGDYFRGMKGGDKDGSLYLSWGEPVKSSGCTSCLGDEWNLSTKITRIRWEKIKKPKRPGLKNTSQGPFLNKAKQ